MKGCFFIKGNSQKLDLRVSFSNFEISLSPNIENINELEKVKEKLEKLEEVGTLEIENGSNEDELIDLALTIKNLLSFGLGEQITFDRTIFKQDDSKKEFKREMVKHSNSGWQIIPNHELRNFLESSIPVWWKMNKEDQKRYFIIIDYLNQSTKGFIEDRILRIAQAWESLTEFLKIEGETPELLLELKKELKKAYRNWKKLEGSDKFDQNGKLGNKITSTINQENLLSKLNNLAEQENLDVEKISLNFKALKNLRDKVAHTGHIEMDGEKAIKILEPAIKGLQIILLKKLKYDGTILYHRNEWETIEKISNFEIEKYEAEH